MGAGKSSLAIRFVKGQFFDYHESTIGAAFQTKRMPQHELKLEIWDTAGQERYHSLAPMYYRGAAAAIVVYDVTDRASFLKAKVWIEELQRQAPENIVVALAANKVDLAEERVISVEEGQTYANQEGLIYVETSAKNDLNVSELFSGVCDKIPKKKTTPAAASSQQRNDVDLNRSRTPGGNTMPCCA